jgi:type I restriction enzyme S subunit
MAFNQTCYALLPRDRLDNDFLFYALKGSIAEMHALTYGTVFDTITTQTLDHWAVPLPPLPDQRAIAAILGALDDKIELNRRMNQTLESMARAIFKSWFVDFDPVRSKAQGRDTALPDRIAALFPESFAESDIGQIPRGWHAAVMGDLCEIARGGAWGDDEPFDDAVEALCLRGVDLEHLRQSGWADAPRRWFKRKHIEDRKMDERDVLVAASGVGPLGRALWVSRDLESAFDLPLIYSNFCKRLRCGSVARAVYIDRWLQLMREDGEIWTYATGTSIPNLDCRSLLQGKVIVAPPDALLDSYAAFVRPIAGRLYFPESRYLAALRDGLLPKLISGELRVPDAERFLATRL